MRKYFQFNGLGAPAALPRRTAFTLAELVVAIGVLLLMLSLAGQVFNLTIQSTGQATALTHISQQLRALERTLRDDLAAVQPGESLIVIQGNPVDAYWTSQGREADPDRGSPGGGPANGYPHVADPEREVELPSKPGELVPVLPRADMLMLFTSREANSYVNPEVTSNVQQVVYGHAELGDYVAVATPPTEPTCDDPVSTARTGAYQFQRLREASGAKDLFPLDSKGYPSLTTECEVPASQWHLARRSVLLMPTAAPPGSPGAPSALVWPTNTLADDRLLRNESDIIWNFNYDSAVLKPKPGPGPALPVVFPLNGCWQPPPAILGTTSATASTVLIPRSKLDPAPPALCANRLGHYLLPNCASFKVEWSLNPRSDFVSGRLDSGNEILWFDPGYVKDQTKPSAAADNPLWTLTDAIASLDARIKAESNPLKKQALTAQRVSLNDLLNVPTAHPDGQAYSLAERFGIPPSTAATCTMSDRLATDGRANLILFAANRRVLDPGTPAPPPTYVPDDVFPGALRITVDVFDPERRLERPIRHVMVIPVGRA